MHAGTHAHFEPHLSHKKGPQTQTWETSDPPKHLMQVYPSGLLQELPFDMHPDGASTLCFGQPGTAIFSNDFYAVVL